MNNFPKDPFKDLVLDKEEQEIEDAIENGKIVAYKPSLLELKKLQQAARNTLRLIKKNKNISLRINEDVLKKLKNKAAVEGIPYQTLIGSLIHKYVNQV